MVTAMRSAVSSLPSIEKTALVIATWAYGPASNSTVVLVGTASVVVDNDDGCVVGGRIDSDADFAGDCQVECGCAGEVDGAAGGCSSQTGFGEASSEVGIGDFDNVCRCGRDRKVDVGSRDFYDIVISERT